jgi:ABC-type molybdate transport system, ATPase component
MLTFSTLAPQSSDLLAREKHRSWKPLPGCANQTPQNISFNGQLFDDSGRNYSLPVRLRRLGYVPQYDSLFPHLSVQRNLLYGSNGKPKDHTLEFHTSSIFWTSDIYSIVTSVRFRVVRINVS